MMVITKIEPQKKHKNRSSVFLDGTFAFGISDFDVHRLHLKEGQELTESDIITIQNEVLTQDAKQYALRLLDARPYTEKALRQKMKDHGCDETAIHNTIEFLKEYGYIDDHFYARQYLESALRSKKSGLKKIMYDLKEKGISREILDELAAEIDSESLDNEEQDAICLLLLRKLKGDFSFQNTMKAKRYCLSRGFSTEAIDRALSSLKSSGEDPWHDEI